MVSGLTYKMTDILFLDQDDTLGVFNHKSQFYCGFYPGAIDFVAGQASLRDVYITTRSREKDRVVVRDIEKYLSGYFGKDSIGVFREESFGPAFRYVRSDGVVRFVEDDYHERRDADPELDRRIIDEQWSLPRSPFPGETEPIEVAEKRAAVHRLAMYGRELIHKETGKPFDESTKYVNTNKFLKNLRLAKELISDDPDSLNAVLVGDVGAPPFGTGDLNAPLSDPSVPVVLMTERMRKGDWHPVEVMLDHLYKGNTAEMYDSFGLVGDGRKSVRVQGLEFRLEVEKGVRRVYCPV